MRTISETIAQAAFAEGVYSIPADVLYPAMLALVVADVEPTLPVPEQRLHYARQLARVRKAESAISDAFLPLDLVAGEPERRAARAEVLELARLWFTAELHAHHRQQTKQGDDARMALHITVGWETCEACGGTGRVEAGQTGVMVPCPICGGAGKIKVPSPWKL